MGIVISINSYREFLFSLLNFSVVLFFFLLIFYYLIKFVLYKNHILKEKRIYTYLNEQLKESGKNIEKKDNEISRLLLELRIRDIFINNSILAEFFKFHYLDLFEIVKKTNDKEEIQMLIEELLEEKEKEKENEQAEEKKENEEE